MWTEKRPVEPRRYSIIHVPVDSRIFRARSFCSDDVWTIFVMNCVTCWVFVQRTTPYQAQCDSCIFTATEYTCTLSLTQLSLAPSLRSAFARTLDQDSRCICTKNFRYFLKVVLKIVGARFLVDKHFPRWSFFSKRLRSLIIKTGFWKICITFVLPCLDKKACNTLKVYRISWEFVACT